MPAILELFIGLIGAFLWETLLRTPTLKLLSYFKKRYLWKKIFSFYGDLYFAKSAIGGSKKSIRESDTIVEREIRNLTLDFKVNSLTEEFSHFEFDHPSANLVIIGSPRYNPYATLVQKNFNTNFEYIFDSYDPDPAQKILKIISQYGDEYVASIDLKTNRLQKGIDYGVLFIANLKNNKKIIWISGIHGPGTLGVFKYLKDNPKIFLDDLPSTTNLGVSWLFRIQHELGKDESLQMIEEVELISEPKNCTYRKTATKPKALICDLGNVIFLFDRFRTYRAIAHWFGLSYHRVAEIIEDSQLQEKYETGEYSDEEFYREIISLFKAPKEMSFELFCEFWGDIFWPNWNIIEALRLLQNETQLILLSNTNNLHFANIREHYNDILALFENRMLLSYKQGMAKPDERIFAKALQLAGSDAKAADCIYIDDKIEYVKVAKQLGMHGITFYSYPQFVYSMREMGLYIP